MQDLLKKLLFGNAGGSNGGAPSLNLSFVDGGTFDPRITFSRGTNATLTDSNGRVAYAPHNLLTNSEDFEAAAWTKSNATITANAGMAPDGTTTADSLVATTTGPQLYQTFTIADSTIVTASVYLKKVSGSDWAYIRIREKAGANYFFWANLVTGAAGSTSGSPTAFSVSSVGNGWYRLTLSGSSNTGATTPFVYVSSADANGSGNALNGDSILVWGAQLNVGALQTYNSTTPKNLLGFTQEPENAAWTKSNSYVQQNLLTWSQDFDNAIWSKVQLNTTGTPAWVNVTTAPDGSTTTDKFIATNVASDHTAVRTDVTGANTYTLSVFAKASEYSFLALWLFQATTVRGVLFDVSNGTFVSHLDSGNQVTSYAVTPVGNGYFRLTITATLTLAQCGFSISNSATPSFTASRLPTFTGDGTSGIFIWGAQLVQGADAGQYTQTTSAAAVTRYTNWDGTLTGRKLVEDTAAATTHRILNAVGVTVPTNGAAANIVYAKAGERTAVRLTDNDIQGADFDLLTGAVSNIGSGVTAAATNVGGGWWRLSVIRTNSTGTGRVVLYLISGGTITYTGDGTSGIYVSDFQLSNSASVDAYVYNPQAAAASAAFYGPRIDFDPVTLASRGLLIEEQRTNLLTYSEDFTNAVWNKGTGGSIIANTVIAPDGSVSADEYTWATSTAAFAYLMQQVSGNPTNPHTYSIWLKRPSGSGSRNVRLAISDITIGSASSSDFTVTETWQRFSFTRTSANSTGLVGGGLGAGLTNPIVAGEILHVWGAQLEAGAFATSYIPTVASQVTRNADSASMLGDNFYTWYNPNQGTLYAEANGLSTAGTRILGIGPGPSNLMYLTLVQNAIVANGTLQASFAFTPATNTAYKTAMAYKANDFASSYSGSIATDVSGSVPVGMTTATIGWVDSAGAFVGSGNIRSIRYYTVRLPDATLQQITS